MMKQCDCGATIRLMQVHPRGRWLPFEARPIMIVIFDSEVWRATLPPESRPKPQPPVRNEWGRLVQAWQPHWATCPNARQHRDKGGRRA